MAAGADTLGGLDGWDESSVDSDPTEVGNTGDGSESDPGSVEVDPTLPIATRGTTTVIQPSTNSNVLGSLITALTPVAVAKVGQVAGVPTTVKSVNGKLTVTTGATVSSFLASPAFMFLFFGTIAIVGGIVVYRVAVR